MQRQVKLSEMIKTWFTINNIFLTSTCTNHDIFFPSAMQNNSFLCSSSEAFKRLWWQLRLLNKVFCHSQKVTEMACHLLDTFLFAPNPTDYPFPTKGRSLQILTPRTRIKGHKPFAQSCCVFENVLELMLKHQFRIRTSCIYVRKVSFPHFG